MRSSDRGLDNLANERESGNRGSALGTFDATGGTVDSGTRPSALRIGLVLVVAVSVLLGVIAAVLIDWNEESPLSGDEPVSGTLIVTLVNAQYVGSGALDYDLYLNDQLESSGTIPVADSAIIEKNLTWVGSEYTVLIHVVIADSATQPNDRLATLAPGETERVNIMLGF